MHNNLEKMRKIAGRSISEVSDHMDVVPTTVYDWQSGRRGMSADILIKLSQFLKCTTDDILGNSAVEYESNDAKILQAARATKLSDDEIVDLLNNLGKYTKK